MIYYLPAFYKP